MLKPAQLYSNELKEKFWNIVYDDKYKFFQGSYIREIEVDRDTWNRHQFASVSKDNELIGYIKYSIDRSAYCAYSLAIINFTENKLFGRDILKALDDIFCKYNLRKLNFNVYIGNPIEKTYDKLIHKYGGRIVGVQKEDILLLDGKYYNKKIYEIFREEYIKNRRN